MPANIWTIAQTPDGYLWLGSVDGLYRFDGVLVERVAEDKLPSPSIHALAATASGGLWIGYERPVGVISFLQHGVVKNYSLNIPSSTSVHNFVIGPDKTVWASTPDYILRFDGNVWRRVGSDWGTSFGEGRGGVWAFGVAKDGVVWSKNLDGLFYLQPGSSHFVQARGYQGGAEGFTTTADGRLWTTDLNAGVLYALPSLNQLRSGVSRRGAVQTLIVRRDKHAIGLPDSLRGSILVDRDGTLWSANFSSGGLIRARPLPLPPNAGNYRGRADTFNARDGLSSDLVHTLFEDREGNIWAGTGLGLDRFRDANLVTEKQIPVGFRARFVQSTKNALYAYTGWSGTETRATDGTESIYRIVRGGSPEIFARNVGRLRGMDVDERTNTLWLVTQRGMQQLKGNGLGPPVALPADVNGSSVLSAVHDKRGAIWISAYRHGVFRQRNGGWKPVAVRSRIGATAILIPDSDGSMWVRYSGGSLFRVARQKIEDFSNNRLNIGDVTFIRAEGNGLIIGGESGIGRIERGKFYALRSSDVPALSGVTGISNTNDGSSWVFTQAGILRVGTGELETAIRRSDPQALKFELFDSRDGLPGAPYGAVYGSSAATDPDGRVWFTTGNGLVWIDPKNLHHNPLPPPVVIRSVTADNRRYDFPVELHLAAGTSKIEVDYAGLSLTMPARNRYRYKLDGVDEGWVDPGSRRQAFYTNLGPGNYKFHVIAANSDGVWNKTGVTLAFSIAPTFFQSWPFYLIVALAAVLLLWAAYSWRMRLVKAKVQSRLETQVAERERIARELHDTLLQGVQGLVLRFQSIADRLPDSQPEKPMLESALDRAESVLIEGRDRVRELRTTDEAGDLAGRLLVVAHDFADPKTKFDLTIEGIVRPLHALACDEASRIGEEAIRNAFLHANARSIDVAIVYMRKELTLTVNDDGKGLDDEVATAGERAGHYGMIGMRERARRIGATLTISSRGGAGCQVMLTIPSPSAYADERQARRFRLPVLSRA